MTIEEFSALIRVPSFYFFDAVYLKWFVEFQYNTCWLWRKKKEPGGLSHQSAKPFSEVDIFGRVFAMRMSPKILDYLSASGKENLLHLREVGNKILNIGANLDEGEFVYVNDGVPLLDGSKVQIHQELLDELAFMHHEAWINTREELIELSRTLNRKDLCPPLRKEHVRWDRSKPDTSWNRDKGNIYGIAYGLAVMDDQHFEVLLTSSSSISTS